MELKLEISPNFTLEDIRKIRDNDYEMTKNMSSKEMVAYYRTGAEKCIKEFEAFKERKRANNHAKT